MSSDFALGPGEEAVTYFKQALSIRREVGNRSGEGKTLNGLGLCYMRMHQPALAAAYFRQSLSVRRALGENRRQIRTLTNLGVCYINLSRHDAALACFLVARTLCENVQELEDDPKNYVVLAQGNIDELSKKIGAEKFAALLLHVEPRAQQIVESVLREQE
jgi:tetratricopeptide (TPR) repeat protein